MMAKTNQGNQEKNLPVANSAQDEAERARRKWTIAIVIAAVVLAGLLVGLGVMWFFGGDSQGARSACIKAADDLDKQNSSLQETVAKAEEIIQTTDATQLADPQIFQDLKLKSQQAGKVFKPSDCATSQGKEKLAKNTSDMLAKAETLKAAQLDLEAAIARVQGAQNAQGLVGVKTELEQAVKTAEDYMKQAQTEEVTDTETMAALSAQIEDAKRLLEQVGGLTEASEDKVDELNESMRAAKDRLLEDIDATKDAINKAKDEKAKKEAEEQLKLLEQQRLEQERQASEAARQQQQSLNNGTNGQKGSLCTVGETITDAQGEQWRCVNIFDQATGAVTPTWMREAAQ